MLRQIILKYPITDESLVIVEKSVFNLIFLPGLIIGLFFRSLFKYFTPYKLKIFLCLDKI